MNGRALIDAVVGRGPVFTAAVQEVTIMAHRHSRRSGSTVLLGLWLLVACGGGEDSDDDAVASGGAATGGARSGGVSSGGRGDAGDESEGGAATGGSPATGGASTGGSPATGGLATGGASTGGDPTTGGDGGGGEGGLATGGTSGDATGGAGGAGAAVTGGAGGAGGAPVGGAGASGGFEPGGAGGGGGAFTRCETAADCVLFAGCCTCAVTPVGTSVSDACIIICEQDQCTRQGFSEADVVCWAGFCGVMGAEGNCNAADALCNSVAPACPEGYLPSVVEDCWGPCVPEQSCLS